MLPADPLALWMDIGISAMEDVRSYNGGGDYTASDTFGEGREVLLCRSLCLRAGYVLRYGWQGPSLIT